MISLTHSIGLRMSGLTGLLAVALLASGCGSTLYRMRQNWVDGKYEKAGMTEHTADLPDAKVKYMIGGKGPAVVLLHGFGGNAKIQWYDNVGALAETYRVVMPNLVYFGGSTAKKSDYTLDMQARVIDQLLEHLKIPKAHMVGVSLGGLVAFNVATNHPRRVDKLVLIDSPGAVFNQADYQRLLESYAAKQLSDVLLPQSPEEVRRIFRIAYYRPPMVPGFLLDDLYEDLFVPQREEQERFAKYLEDNIVPLGKRTYRKHQPTLIVWGDHDILFPIDIAKRLKGWYGDAARLEFVKDTAHMPCLERPREVNRLLLAFFAEE